MWVSRLCVAINRQCRSITKDGLNTLKIPHRARENGAHNLTHALITEIIYLTPAVRVGISVADYANK